MARPSVVVVGGGIAGLAAAWELSGGADADADAPRIEVIEAGPRVGGVLAAAPFAGRDVDLGADGFLARRPEATALVRELGWGERLEAIAASGASIWLRGALHDIPAGLALGVPTSSAAVRAVGGLSWRARAAARRDELFPRRLEVGEDATIGEILRTKLGAELAYRFIEPMVGGIQAGRIDDLSARAVFPTLLEAAREGGSLMRALRPRGPVQPGPAAATVADAPLFYSLTGGVGSLAPELVRRLRERGVVVREGVDVTAIRRTPADTYPLEVDTADTTTPADAVVVAASAPVAAALLGTAHPDLAALSAVPYAGAAMVTVSLARGVTRLPDHGTGVLVPLATRWSGEGSMMITALTFLDRKWPRLARADDVLVRAHVGRSDDERWAAMDDDALVARVLAELAELLGAVGEVFETRVQRWPRGLPQYRLGHLDLVQRARAAASPLGVALAGSAYDGVGVPASIGSGRRAAREALALVAAARG
jgi:protoporphyrinogen/coproporphyrinogen III oxidase